MSGPAGNDLEPDPCQVSADTFGRLAGGYATRYFDLPLYDAALADFAAAIGPDDGLVLDLACGPGNVAARLLRARPRLQVLGWDLAPGMVDEARRRVPGARFETGDARQVHRLGEAVLDAAAFGFGLSYLPDAAAGDCLRALFAALRPGAPLYLSTLTGEPAREGWETGRSGDRVWMARRPVAEVLARVEAAGFELLSHDALSSPAQAREVTRDLQLLARRPAAD